MKQNDLQKCARLLPLNSPETLRLLSSNLRSILSRICENSNDEKFQKLNFSSTLFQNVILPSEGGIDFLRAVGFEQISIGDKEYFSIIGKFASTELKHIVMSSQTWLERLTDVWLNSPSSLPNSCAPCVIKIIFPNNTSVSGGFLSTESIDSVLSYVKCYFIREDLREKVVLRTFTSNIPLPLDSSLSELGLAPRSVIVASISPLSLTEEERFVQSHTRHVEEVESKREELRNHKVEVKNVAEERKKERAILLGKFKEDRETKAERDDWERLIRMAELEEDKKRWEELQSQKKLVAGVEHRLTSVDSRSPSHSRGMGIGDDFDDDFPSGIENRTGRQSVGSSRFDHSRSSQRRNKEYQESLNEESSSSDLEVRGNGTLGGDPRFRSNQKEKGNGNTPWKTNRR